VLRLGVLQAQLAIVPAKYIQIIETMSIRILPLVWSLAGLLAGGIIGASFGVIQNAASRRHLERQQAGQLNNGWAVMPSSMRRIAYLLGALALVQLIFPLLFTTGYQWWVSVGVVTGYGLLLFVQLRQRLAQTH
jgi:hypothetical protein